MVTRIELEPAKRFEYLAGQYVGLRYRGNSRAYSIASSPTRTPGSARASTPRARRCPPAASTRWCTVTSRPPSPSASPETASRPKGSDSSDRRPDRRPSPLCGPRSVGDPRSTEVNLAEGTGVRPGRRRDARVPGTRRGLGSAVPVVTPWHRSSAQSHPHLYGAGPASKVVCSSSRRKRRTEARFPGRKSCGSFYTIRG